MHRVPVDRKGKFEHFSLKALPFLVQSKIHTMTLCRVDKYHKKISEIDTCDLVPLPLQSDGSPRPKLNDVIVPASISMQNDLKTIVDKINEIIETVNPMAKTDIKEIIPEEIYKQRPIIKHGSVVVCGFFDREIDNFDGSNDNYTIDTKRMHSLDAPVVLEVIKS